MQSTLQAARARPRRGRGKADATTPAPLAGKFRDETGDRLTPSYTTKGSKRFCYYISNRLISGNADPAAWRLPARALETLVAKVLANRIETLASRHALSARPDAVTSDAIAARARDLVRDLRGEPETLLRNLIRDGAISAGQITVILEGPVLAGRLGLAETDLAADTLVIAAPFQCRRRGVETRLVAGDPTPAPDRVLIEALAKAHLWVDALRNGESLGAIAARERVSDAFISTRLQLAFLAPQIQTAMLEGQLPADLTLERTADAAWRSTGRCRVASSKSGAERPVP